MKAGQLVINRYLEGMAITREIANHVKRLQGIRRCKLMYGGLQVRRSPDHDGKANPIRFLLIRLDHPILPQEG